MTITPSMFSIRILLALRSWTYSCLSINSDLVVLVTAASLLGISSVVTFFVPLSFVSSCSYQHHPFVFA